MARKLKVFRTAIGFHDAYVAAPSRKAALAAWGSTADLFARGVAEEVDDPALTVEPLANPGEVVKRSRGTAAEQMAALPADPIAPPPTSVKPIPRSKPSRADLDAAEASLSAAMERHRKDLDDMAERDARLTRERQEMEQRHATDTQRLQKRRDAARATFDDATRAWVDGQAHGGA